MSWEAAELTEVRKICHLNRGVAVRGDGDNAQVSRE